MVGIVILDYNNAADTINCIESVVKYTPASSYKIVVVENGSDFNTTDTISRYVNDSFPDKCMVIDDNALFAAPLHFITVVISKSNDGYAQGNNKALRLLEGDSKIDHIMILNNDILFTEDIVSPLIKYLNTLPNSAIVCPLLTKRDGKTIDLCCARNEYKLMHFFWEYLFLMKDIFGIVNYYGNKVLLLKSHPKLVNKEYFDIEMPSGSCMLLRKDLFKEIGYFDPNTFLYFEENILFQKIKKLGLKNYIIPKYKCIHLGASTSKKTPSAFIMKCQMDSTVYYLRNYRNAPILALFVNMMAKLIMVKIHIQQLILK